jgi:hypothetical protein
MYHQLRSVITQVGGKKELIAERLVNKTSAEEKTGKPQPWLEMLGFPIVKRRVA